MRKHLTLKELAIMGGGVFSLHFGAACLLYPVTWGAEAGSAVWLMFAGVFLSGIILPWLGYLALARGEGTFFDLLCRPAPKFGAAFMVALIVIMGPSFLTPRVTAALWLGILQLTGWEFASPWAIIVYNVVLYSVAFCFLSNAAKVLERIGKFLFPLIVVIVAAIIAYSVALPMAPRAAPAFTGNPVAHGFLAAYTAADLQCALVYGLVIVHSIGSAGIEPKSVNRNLLMVGIIGLGLLGAVHLGHMLAGANTGGTIKLRLSALYMQMVIEMWGRVGGLVFLAALAIATLTAVIGLTSSTAALWVEVLKGRVRYRVVCAVSCVLGAAVSSLGIDTVVDVISPVLDAFYPATIVVTFYYCLRRHHRSLRNLFALRWAMIASTLMALIALLHEYVGVFSLELPAFERFYASLPLSRVSMSWVPVALAAYVVAWLFARGLVGESSER